MTTATRRTRPGEPEAHGLTTVVLATDFTRDARAALRRVALLPYRRGARAVVVHVLPPRVNRAADSVVRAAADQHLEQACERLRQRLRKRGRDDVRVFPRLVRGQAAEEIGLVAGLVNADLTVLGRRGHRTLRERLLGSVAERLSRHARRPVLVVARNPQRPYRATLVGFDLSEAAAAAFRLARRLTGPDAEVVVVHVFENPYLTGPVTSGYQPRLISAEQVVRALPTPPPGRDPWPVILRPGDARKVILQRARRDESDLIALGSMGRSGVARQLIGSVAEGVLQLAPVDVLIVPAKG